MTRNNRNGPKTVLIVDDDVAALEEMAETLRDYGLSVCEADRGSTALALAKEHQPRVVLMDFNLPGVNGLTIVHRMQEFLPNSSFIMISGMDAFCKQATTANTNTFAVLKKPVSMDSIARYISNTFQQSGDKVLDATTMMTA